MSGNLLGVRGMHSISIGHDELAKEHVWDRIILGSEYLRQPEGH